jgi:hypothetical protein
MPSTSKNLVNQECMAAARSLEKIQARHPEGSPELEAARATLRCHLERLEAAKEHLDASLAELKRFRARLEED